MLCISFLGLLSQITKTWMFTKTEISCSRAQMSEMKILAEPCTLWRPWGEGFSDSSGFWGSPAVVDVSWLLDASPQSLRLSLQGFLPMCVFLRVWMFPLVRTLSHIGFRLHSNDLILTLQYLWLPDKVTFTGSKGTWPWGGHPETQNMLWRSCSCLNVFL